MAPTDEVDSWRTELSRSITRVRTHMDCSAESLTTRARVTLEELADVEAGRGAPTVYARIAAVLDIPKPDAFPAVSWDDMGLLLGQATDTRIADYLAKSREAVRQRRERAGIERATPRTIEVTEQAADRLHALTTVMPIRQAQAVLHLRRVDVRRLRAISGRNGRSTPPWAAEIGTRPDPEVAVAAGVHVSTVRRWRRKLGIEAYAYFGAATEDVLRKASAAARAYHMRRRAVGE